MESEKSRKKRPREQVVVDHLLNLETMEKVAKLLVQRSPAAAKMLSALLSPAG